MHDSRRLTCHRPQNPPPWPLQKVSPEPPRKASTTCKLDDMGQSTDHAAQESNPGSLLGGCMGPASRKKGCAPSTRFSCAMVRCCRAGPLAGTQLPHPGRRPEKGALVSDAPEIGLLCRLTPRHPPSMSVEVLAKRHGPRLSFHTNIQHQPSRLPDTETAFRVDDYPAP